jgi:hypothetical protein
MRLFGWESTTGTECLYKLRESLREKRPEKFRRAELRQYRTSVHQIIPNIFVYIFLRKIYVSEVGHDELDIG